MAQKIDAEMPENMIIGDGWTIEWAAVHPTTGAAVSGVKVTNTNVVAADLSVGAGTGDTDVGDFKLVPGPGA